MARDVSVIVAAWNAAETLEEAVHSALGQAGVDVRVLVADDCSTDGTFALAERLARQDSRVRVLRTEANGGGAAAARNLALAHVETEWIAILDADDSFMPGRLTRLVDFAKGRDLDIAFDNFRYVGPDGEPIADRVFWPEAEFDGGDLWTLAYFVRNNRPYRSPRLLGFLKPLIRTEFLRANRLVYNVAVPVSEDYMLVVEALHRGARAAAIPDIGYNYVLRPNSVSSAAGVTIERQQAFIDAEQAFLDTHGPAMTSRDRGALAEHLHCLKLALQSHLMFQALRERDPGVLLAALQRAPLDAPVQLGRIARSALRKLQGRRAIRGG